MIKNRYLFHIILLPIVFLIGACAPNFTEGNLVSFNNGEFKNNLRHEVIKIDDDEINNYYIAIQIPEDFIQNSYSRRSKDSIVDEFVYEPTYSRLSWDRMLIIAKDFKFNIKKDDLNYYFSRRDNYIVKNFKPYKRLVAKDLALGKFDTITVSYEKPCKPNIKQICLPGQKAFSTMIIFRGKNYFWSIEYLLNIPHNNSKKESMEMIKSAKKYMRNCCHFFSVKKDLFPKDVDKKEVVKKFLGQNEI